MTSEGIKSQVNFNETSVANLKATIMLNFCKACLGPTICYKNNMMCCVIEPRSGLYECLAETIVIAYHLMLVRPTGLFCLADLKNIWSIKTYIHFLLFLNKEM